MLVPQFENLPPTVVGVSLSAHDHMDRSPIDRICDALESTIAAAEETGLASAQAVIESCRESQRTALDSVLRLSGQSMVGTVYLQQLDAVLRSLRHELCHRFLAQVAAKYLQEKIGEAFPSLLVFAKLPLSPFNPLGVVRDMLVKISDTTEISEREAARFFQSIFDAVDSHLRSNSNTESFLDCVLDRYVHTMIGIDEQLQNNQNQQATIHKEQAARKDQSSLLKRWFVRSGQHNTDKHALAQQREHLIEQRKALETTSAWTETFVRGLFERVVSPYLVRIRIVNEICAEHSELNAKLEALYKESAVGGILDLPLGQGTEDTSTPS